MDVNSKPLGLASSEEDVWRYCSVCRQNHEGGRKHIFTKKHLNKLKIVMGKFSKKVRSARKCLTHPVVLDGELEPGVKVWCCCCQEEIVKHVTDGYMSIEWGGLIEHLCKPEHHKKTRHYWWENGVDAKQLQTYLIFPAESRQYKEKVSLALKDLEDKRNERMKMLADKLRATERLQAITALEPPTSSQPPSVKLTDKDSHTRAYCSGESSKGHLMRVPPLGQSQPLSRVSPQQNTQGGRGNIHSGATPPWLRDDDDEESVSPIGPSLDAFIKHRERLKRASKNPKRVGADFHIKLALQKQRGEEDDDDWLPSFGSVWNPGPRSHTQLEFRRQVEQTGKKVKLHNLSTPSLPSIQPSSHIHTSHNEHSSLPLARRIVTTETSEMVSNSDDTVKPYVRKRIMVSQENTRTDAYEDIELKPKQIKLEHRTNEEQSDSCYGDIPVSTEPNNGAMIKPYTRKRKNTSIED